ncbi:hypothetical protein M3Y97_00594900 [Aphelenchoides bicaudatus]|nr:hypothetical protein M3Y97_00594900 [Aphelenchoides bicaudatus]
MSRNIKFFYDIGSLHSWILFEQLCAAERCFGFRIQFYPVRMTSIYTATGYKNPYYILGIRKHMFNEVQTLKKLYDVPFVVPTNAELKLSYIGTNSAQQFLTHIKLNYPDGLRNASRFLWRRLWVQDSEVYGNADFDEIVRKSDLKLENEDFSNGKTEAALHSAEKEALSFGCYEVPFTVIEQKDKSPSIFTGMDSWPLIAGTLDLPSDRKGFYSLRSFNHLFDKTMLHTIC